jgi:uncharacterized cupredoxin-like copper-binding protein
MIVFVAVLLLGTACGGDGGTSAGGGHDGHAAGEKDTASKDGGFAFGEPADAADADRTITVTGTDELKFEPDELEIEAGETIAFEFKNSGDLAHEFVFGDEDALGGHAHGGDQPYGTGEVPGGGTKTIVWTFDEAGELSYECHVDDHHEAGMRGTITVN